MVVPETCLVPRMLPICALKQKGSFLPCRLPRHLVTLHEVSFLRSVNISKFCGLPRQSLHADERWLCVDIFCGGHRRRRQISQTFTRRSI